MLIPVLLAFCAALMPGVALLFLFLWVALYRAPATTRKGSLGRSAAVVVLGDVGRSPRMCYHVESLANEGWRVAVVGYKGTPPPPPLRRSSIKHHHLRESPRFISRLPRAAFALVAPFKVLWQSAALFWELTARVQPPPEVLLVQTPPALPTLFVVRIVSILMGSRVIIDWHNLAYTILALRMGEQSALVKVARVLERWTGRTAFAHLFVTRAMMEHLDREWGLQGRKAVLHDRAPAHFRKSTASETHRLWCRLAPQLDPPCGEAFLPRYAVAASTPFTLLAVPQRQREDSSESATRPHSPAVESMLRPNATPLASPINTSVIRPQSWSPASARAVEGGAGLTHQLRSDRPALVVSSTSWTADEDFSLLLRAAALYERRARELALFARAAQKSASSPTLEEPSRHDGGGAPWTHNVRRNSGSAGSLNAMDPSLVSGSPGIESTRDRSRRPSLSAIGAPETLPNLPARRLPKMLLVVTGKGALREQYEREIEKLEREEQWEFVRIRTAWLESEEYPVLLGSADVGISLHISSSGLDLPMKVVDMLGCELPVCALDFACLDELIANNHNGLTFRDAEELARQLESLLALHPNPSWLAASLGNLSSPFDIPPKPKVEPSASSERFTMVLDTNLPRSSSPPETPRSSSPLPFSLMPSPVLVPRRYSGGAISPTPSISTFNFPPSAPSTPTTPAAPALKKRKAPAHRTSTWAGNWKAVVRPLLHAADAEDAADSAHRRTGTLSSAAFKAQTHARLGSTLEKNAFARGFEALRRRGRGAVGARGAEGLPLSTFSSPRSSGEVERRSSGSEEEANAHVYTGREARERLTQRRTPHGAARQDTWGSTEGGMGEALIPDIQVSAPARH